tara:strand:+ start:45202 stop:46233 length:1032 start_codon:yes stop_codon:yes gene_type:complete
MINLNKELVSKEGLLNHIQDIDVYRFYTGSDIILNTGVKSPLSTDNNPSFGYFVSKTTGEICFNDYRIGGGDFIKFVQLKYGLNYFEALSKIAIDFNLEDYFHVKYIKKTSKSYNPKDYPDKDYLIATANNFELRKKSRELKLHDLTFWMQFGIDIDKLNEYNVTPVSYIFINGKPIFMDKFAYCFTEYKDDKETYKIYQPYNEDYKWLNNHDASVWQGWNQLPDKSDILVITKSLKDVMAITNLTDISSISLQSEATIPKDHIIKELDNRFLSIYLLYDNDYDKEVNWGYEFGKKLADKYKFFQINIDEKHKSKDFSDLVKNVGKEKAKSILIEMINGYLPY